MVHPVVALLTVDKMASAAVETATRMLVVVVALLASIVGISDNSKSGGKQCSSGSGIRASLSGYGSIGTRESAHFSVIVEKPMVNVAIVQWQ